MYYRRMMGTQAGDEASRETIDAVDGYMFRVTKLRRMHMIQVIDTTWKFSPKCEAMHPAHNAEDLVWFFSILLNWL
jgi:hypothetical protein